jgi:hypothetical protein
MHRHTLNRHLVFSGRVVHPAVLHCVLPEFLESSSWAAFVHLALFAPTLLWKSPPLDYFYCLEDQFLLPNLFNFFSFEPFRETHQSLIFLEKDVTMQRHTLNSNLVFSGSVVYPPLLQCRLNVLNAYFRRFWNLLLGQPSFISPSLQRHRRVFLLINIRCLEDQFLLPNLLNFFLFEPSF